MRVIIKAAKKSLKKQKEGQMVFKELVKSISDTMGDEHSVTAKQVKNIIRDSEKFHVDGKVVRLLNRKRSMSPNSPSDEFEKTVISSSSAKKAKIEKEEESITGDVITSADDNNNSNNNSVQSVHKWRKQNKIVIMSCDDDDNGNKKTIELNNDKCCFPYTSFNQPECINSILPELLNHCTNVHQFTKPSPIQAQSWPIMMQNENTTTTTNTNISSDIVGIAETGSGKTLAFALPALSSMVKEGRKNNNNNNGKKIVLPRMLVLSPTRELAMQSNDVIQDYGSVVNINSLVLYGGVPKHTQLAILKKGNIDCIVATPGRLKDFIQDGTCNLSSIKYLVLDEADRMLDMGFEEDVRYIISNCMSKENGRQTSMFSATWPAAIRKIAMDYMNNPIRVYVGFESIVGSNGTNEIDDSLSANKRVKQTIEVIDDRNRDHRLREILKQIQTGKRKNDRVLVFALYKKEAERIENSLRRDGYNCCSIHGNKNQMARTEALSQFKDGTCPLLVATDVAARGLDIPNVEVVINYTFPLTIEDYVHRIGRTGRAGKTGESYTFFQPTDKSHAGELQQLLKQVGQPIPDTLAKFGSTIKKKEHKLYGNFGPRTDLPIKKATKITFDSDAE